MSMRTSAIFSVLLCLITFVGCDAPNVDVPPTPNPEPVPTELEFKIDVKRVGMYDVEIAITPPNDTIVYGCGVASGGRAEGLEYGDLLARLAMKDANHQIFSGEGVYRGGGFLPSTKQAFICYYDPVSCGQYVSETTEAIVLEFNTLPAPEAKNYITKLELCGPYSREGILNIDPSIGEVAASDEGMWYFYRIETANDNTAMIYSYPTYQLGLLDDYERLFALLIQNGWRAEKHYFNHIWDNDFIMVYAMVQDEDGVVSQIVASEVLKNDMECRDAQEFVDFYNRQL